MNGANYRDMEGGQLNGNGKWPTIRILKLPTILIWKVANNRDMEGGQI